MESRDDPRTPRGKTAKSTDDPDMDDTRGYSDTTSPPVLTPIVPITDSTR